MASLSISSCRMAVTGAPDAVRPDILRDGTVRFWCENLKVTGVVGLAEGATDPDVARILVIPRILSGSVGMGWRAGWVQLCCQEEVWALYRGEKPADGTIRATWPSYEALDTKSSDTSEVFVSLKPPFYKLISAASPAVSVEFTDIPIQDFTSTILNTETKKINTLAVSVARFSFILALAAKDPEDNLHVLKWVPWWVRWESTYKLTGVVNTLTETPVKSRTQSGTGNPQYGIPAKLVNAIKLGSGASANTLAQKVDVKCHPKWQDLAHLRPLPPMPAPARKPAPATPEHRGPAWERR